MVDEPKDCRSPAVANGSLLASDEYPCEPKALIDGSSASSKRLRLNPNKNHVPEKYDGMQLDFCPSVFSSLERYLPPGMLGVSRDDKARFMTEILLKHLPHGERIRALKHKEHRQLILSHYQPLHMELYTMCPGFAFVSSFTKAITDNTEESFRSIMSEPFPGVFTFQIFQPQFCQLLLSEVENFEKWVVKTKVRIMLPNTMNKNGSVLDDFGLEMMLNSLVNDFIRPISKVFFPDVGGATLDSHHGYIVQYGKDRDIDLGFHIDDSEVTLNVCLGKQFSGGELYFRGIRCHQHINTKIHLEEIFDCSHVPGRAILHRGHHRHGARATTSGNRVNLLLWCRSSVFREMKKYQNKFPSWCKECMREKEDRKQAFIEAAKLKLLGLDGGGKLHEMRDP